MAAPRGRIEAGPSRQESWRAVFKDVVILNLRSGDGGPGLVSFRREAFVPKGGPDGGDGGKGGDVVFLCDPQLDTLGAYHDRQRFAAENGRPGGPGLRTGRSGADLLLPVPPGTVVKDEQRGHVLKDLDAAGERFVLLRGGRGGRGNAAFATSVNQTPRRAERGRPGGERAVLLELKLIAHVGIVGLPNAGKSTLLARISNARPRIAEYPFTTLTPQLGMVEIGVERYVFADIPGLIEGAHQGQGLGDQFLRHIERTQMLLHVIDCQLGGAAAIVKAYRTVRAEIASYSAALAGKPEVVALSKADALASPPAASDIALALRQPVLVISAHSGLNLKQLLGAVAALLDGLKAGTGRPGLRPSRP